MSDCENFASIYEFAIQMFQDFSHLVVWQSIEEYKKITLHIIYFILNITLHLQLAHQTPFHCYITIGDYNTVSLHRCTNITKALTIKCSHVLPDRHLECK